MSLTRVWLPNEMARPRTEAPAISGVMLTPKSWSATSTAMTPMTITIAILSNGIMVLSRDAGGPAASPPAIASAALLVLCSMYGSVAYLNSSQITKARNRVMPAVRDERVIWSHSLSLARPNTWTTQLSAIVTETPISTATRTQRATTSGSFGALLAGVRPASCESRRRTNA